MVGGTRHSGSPTISDVAERAGVSRAVVSRALSPEPRPVSADKRERVLKAAAELGFKPNLLAQSLVSKSVNLVAVVVNHIHDFSDLDLFDLLLDRIQSTGKQVILIRVGSVGAGRGVPAPGHRLSRRRGPGVLRFRRRRDGARDVPHRSRDHAQRPP